MVTLVAALGVWVTAQRHGTISEDGKIVVAVSIPPMAEWVEKIGGETVRVVVLIPHGANPHIYEPPPSKIIEASRAEIIVLIGLGFEHWAEEILDINREAHVIRVSSIVKPIMVDGKPDPHMWLSPKTALKVIPEIQHALSEVKPEKAELYKVRLQSYREELLEADREISVKLSNLKVRKFFVLHPAWGYFARDYELEQVAVFWGEDVSAAHLVQLVEEARALEAKTIFVEPWCSEELKEILSRETGCDVEVLDPLAPNYVENLRVSASRIAEELGEG
jgi:zinc transport system substrate-binding protein